MFNFLFLIGQDKWMHFSLSLVLCLLLYAIASIFGLGAIALIPAFIITMTVGVIKELYDKKHGGVFDHNDIAADFIGCFVAIVIASLLLI